jgi:hypothetical protein
MEFNEPVYTILPTADFINSQERIIFLIGGTHYIIYGPEPTGDDVWSVFIAKEEHECGSDDAPDHEFDTYAELLDWVIETFLK